MSRQEPEIIKCYGKPPSVRLYNTTTAGYVSRAELAEMLLEGRRFIVREAGTGEDLTEEVLASLH